MYKSEVIRAAMAIQRINKTELAKRTELSRDTVGLIVDGKQADLKISSMGIILRELNLDWSDVMESVQAA